MSLIGVITQAKSEGYVIDALAKEFGIDNIIFITEKNIANVKNIQFGTILIDRSIEQSKELKEILTKTKYLVLNADLDIELETLRDLNVVAITYGFNNKATLTLSSVSENHIIICLQRVIHSKNNKQYEPQEIEIEVPENTEISSALGILAIMLIYEKSDIYYI